MRRYALSEEAESDLDEIVTFIAGDSMPAAHRVLDDLDVVQPIQILRIVSGYRDLADVLR